jgi:glycerate 2-kinase
MVKPSDPGMTRETLRALALEIFRTGLAAADPAEAVRRCLAQDTAAAGFLRSPRVDLFRRVLLVGAGKAAGAMAVPVWELLGGRIDGGCIVTPSQVALPGGIRIVCGSHPLPDDQAVAGAAEILSLAESAGERDLLIVVLSGGGSALLPLPVPGVSLEDLRLTTDILLRAGADIFELNTVRKHLSRIQGGRLARAAAPATVVTLVLSDVVGNQLEVVASGPTVPDSTTFADAWAVLEKYGPAEERGISRPDLVAGSHDDPSSLPIIDPLERGVVPRGAPRRFPASVRAYLRRGLGGDVAESPKPGDPVFARTCACVVADNRTALTAMRRHAEARGFLVKELNDPVIGEAREGGAHIGRELVRLSGREPGVTGTAPAERSAPGRGTAPAVEPFPAAASATTTEGICLLFGGETTVTVRGPGHGGRSQELAVAAAIELAEAENPAGVVLLAAGTDGIDGHSTAAGGLVDGTTLARAGSRGLDPREALRRNDSTAFLDGLGDLVVTGPTGTNVGDVGVGLLGLVCGPARSGPATMARPAPGAPA